MKGLIKNAALLVSLFAAIRLLIEEFIRIGLGGDSGAVTGWLGTLADVALTPLPVSNLWILTFSLSILAILLFFGRTKLRSVKQAPLPHTLPRESVPEKAQSFISPLFVESLPIIKKRVEEEWNSLEELDKETIREMVVQGGLWESDIIALLQARGFLYHTVRYDSLAERVSFVECDYAGYHSILPEYHSLLEGVLATDYAEDSY